jgi:hypothetical protein
METDLFSPVFRVSGILNQSGNIELGSVLEYLAQERNMGVPHIFVPINPVKESVSGWSVEDTTRHIIGGEGSSPYTLTKRVSDLVKVAISVI